MESKAVPVVQGAREAAASGYFAWISGNPVIPGKMLAGQADDHSMVQAFARYRLSVIEECAQVAKAWLDSDYDESANEMARNILEDIRALSSGVGEG